MPRRSASKTYARKLGARIRALREGVGITQERLAWDCDLDKSYLSQVEAGKRVPSVPMLGQLAQRLGVGPADLLAFDLEVPRYALLDAARRGDRAAMRDALRHHDATILTSK